MSTRHEIPSQRRLSAEETEASTSRPLSSSFFAPIDHTIPARQSSLHLYRQYIFPTKKNRLDSDLEVPYAFSHRHAAFYWTEDDALENHKLNIWAKPPCLNCELAGEDYARQCDRYENQEDSEGRKQCCTRCQRKGDHQSCIEQLEIRADGNYARVLRHTVDPEDSTTVENEDSTTADSEDTVDSEESATLDNADYITVEFDQWCGEEQELRRNGLVWWEPINLECGNADRKEEMVEQWKQRDAQTGSSSAQRSSDKVCWRRLKQVAPHQWGTPMEQIDSGKVSWENFRARKQALEERMSLCKQINEELVAEWSREEGDLKREAEEDALARRLQPDGDRSVLELEREKTYWVEKIDLERARQYHQEVMEVGQEVAELSQSAWEAREGHTVSQACHFLERKQYWMKSGVGEKDAIALSKAETSNGAEEELEPFNDLEELVPGIFRAGL